MILAAGKGTRMKSSLPKALTPLCGEPMLGYLLSAVEAAGCSRKIVVGGFGYESVRAHVGARAQMVRQAQLLGSGHAVMQAEKFLKNHQGPVLVVYCDTPLIKGKTLRKLIENHVGHKTVCTLLSAALHDPTGYGRVVRGFGGSVLKIVEENDASGPEKDIREINVGCYVADRKRLFGALKRVKKNSRKGEYYLTDAIAILAQEGRVEAVVSNDRDEVLGVNSKKELCGLEAAAQIRILEGLMEAGVRVRDPQTTTVDVNVKIGQDTVLLPHTVIEEGSVIGKGCVIGPFARVRGGSRIGDGTVVGNFVEIVRSTIGRHTNVKHLSYLGDARVGSFVNIGAGTVTANYDGKHKHKTVIRDHAHTGSGTVLIAPLKVGKGATTGAGAVVTRGHNVPDRAVVVGVPAKLLKR